MDKRVTVIVPDKMVCVAGEWRKCEALPASEGVRAIQWIPGKSQHIEYHDGRPNEYITDYAGMVGPFVEAFNAEERRTKEAAPEPSAEKDSVTARLDEIETELSALDRYSIRPGRAKDNGTATGDDLRVIAYLEERADELRAEQKALLAERTSDGE